MSKVLLCYVAGGTPVQEAVAYGRGTPVLYRAGRLFALGALSLKVGGKFTHTGYGVLRAVSGFY